MNKTNPMVLTIVIINLVITLIISSYLIIVTPYQRYNFDNGNDDVIDVTGVVTNITERNDGIVMLVEDSDSIGTYDKAYVTVTKETFIIKTLYSRTLEPNEINIGDKVEVKFKGPIAESYPVQAKAKWIWITESNVE